MELEHYLTDLRARHDKVRPASVPTDPEYPLGHPDTVPAHVSHWARKAPDRAALVFEGRTWTYAQLDDSHRRLASWMSARGVAAGDRVAVHLGNSPEFVVAFLAILRLGAVHVPVNPMFQPAELAHEINDAEPHLLLTEQELLPVVEAAREHLPRVEVACVDDDDTWPSVLSHPSYQRDDGDLDSVAALNYTGGTTGLPKGCMHSQRDMVYTVASAASATRLPHDGSYVGLCYLPVFWIAGEDLGILLPFVLGGTSVLMRRWDVRETIEAIEQHRVTLMTGTVENYLEIMDQPDITERDLSSLKDPQAVSFIRKMSPEVRRAWAGAVPGSVLRESSYGMTETHTIDVVPYGFAKDDEDLLAEPVFCGIPVPGTDVAVVAFGTQEPVPLGDIGEIIVRSPSVTSGYWRNEAATRDQLVEGWIHTGDNGRIDEKGFLHYLGRRKEMIKVKGMSVFPADVEMLLSQHPAVDSVAVVPTDDPDTGQRPVAFVVRRPSHSVQAEELAAWSRQNMAPYKVPVVVVTDRLPLTATGKVRKHELEGQARTANAAT